MTDNGRRTLIAVHLRRTDYHLSELPWFRIIPEEWYLAWLREIWPTLTDPVLFVATDEPESVLAHFAEFSPKSSVDLAGLDLPDHVGDFEILRGADYLAICNSSFSRMAAILAAETQRCFLPSLPERRIVPYEPWGDKGFWRRFGEAAGERQHADSICAADARQHRGESSVPHLYLDITDLLFHLRSHSTISGIQRVQCELVCNLIGRSARCRGAFYDIRRPGFVGCGDPGFAGHSRTCPPGVGRVPGAEKPNPHPVGGGGARGRPRLATRSS